MKTAYPIKIGERYISKKEFRGKLMEMIITVVIFVGAFIFIIAGNVIRLLIWIKCHNAETCCDRKCRWYQYCQKGQETITIEDIEWVYRAIEEHKNKAINQK